MEYSAGASSLAARSVAFSPTGTELAVGNADGTAQLWNVNTGDQFCKLVGHGGAIGSVSFTSDGRFLATGSVDGTAIVWNVATGKSQWQFRSHMGGITSVQFSHDGRTLITGTYDGRIILWDVASGEERSHFEHGKWVSSVAVSPTRQILASAGGGGAIKLCRAAREREVQAAGTWWNR